MPPDNRKPVERPDDAKKKQSTEAMKELKKDRDDEDFDNLADLTGQPPSQRLEIHEAVVHDSHMKQKSTNNASPIEDFNKMEEIEASHRSSEMSE